MFSVHTETQNRRFQIPPAWRIFSKGPFSWQTEDLAVWTEDLTVETELRLRDGLVWMVVQTVEIKPPA